MLRKLGVTKSRCHCWGISYNKGFWGTLQSTGKGSGGASRIVFCPLLLVSPALPNKREMEVGGFIPVHCRDLISCVDFGSPDSAISFLFAIGRNRLITHSRLKIA